MNKETQNIANQLLERVYPHRVIGHGFASIAISTSFAIEQVTLEYWGLLFVWGLLWPHFSKLLSVKSKNVLKQEKANLYIDAFIIGMWLPTISFTLVTSAALVGAHLLSVITILGLSKMLKALTFTIIGALVSYLLFNGSVHIETEPLLIMATIPLLSIYPLIVGFTTYHLSLQLASKSAMLKKLSLVDGLTRLNNRQAWEDQLRHSFKWHKRNQSIASILFIDVDHFKQINDRYGHLVGDQVLIKIAQIIASTARDTDICGRYGGEEFCILMPNTCSTDAYLLSERLRLKIAESCLHKELQIKASVSLGIAEIRDQTPTYTDWLSQADTALYVAKNQGRNQTIVATASQGENQQ